MIVEMIQITTEQLSQIINDALSNQLERLSLNVPQQNKGTDLLSRAETASYFGISRPCLADWTKKGIIKGHKVGGRVFYRRSELELLTTNKKG